MATLQEIRAKLQALEDKKAGKQTIVWNLTSIPLLECWRKRTSKYTFPT